ncbi:hypothetical protein J2X13_001473 [Aminobacter aminovorans]|nr:hypothetical protein [Aminobacter aminovorans]
MTGVPKIIPPGARVFKNNKVVRWPKNAIRRQIGGKFEFWAEKPYLRRGGIFIFRARRGFQILDVVMENFLEKAQSRSIEAQKKTAERNSAMAEYQSEAKARAIKTAKLRELRLAKDEADRAAEALKPVEPKKKRVARAAK